MDLERILHSQGFGTRRQCRALIHAGSVSIAGLPHTDPAAQIDTAALTLTIDGSNWPYRARAYLALHKPAGVECSHQPQHHRSVFALLPAPLVARGVQSVGRLDQDTTGLLLLSDDGSFVHAHGSPKRHVPKTYRVTLAAPVTDAQLSLLNAGVLLHGETAPLAAQVRKLDASTIELTITEGKYHQVKRMVAAAGNHVAALHRAAIGGLALPATLAPGQWMWLDDEHLRQLAAPALTGVLADDRTDVPTDAPTEATADARADAIAAASAVPSDSTASATP